ncbi:hypothetical protein [Dactylosporangium maewongense]|uniref:hypothetical protein n=1 Tax=Dactylosporangium maewongense TaxID=634393 RepID=UPI0031E15E7D
MSRAIYQRWDLRWEAACTDMLADPRRHAYGLFRATLCGIERPDMTGSQFGMWGGRPGECPACTAAARAIDARWPVQRRDVGDVFVDITPLPLPRDVPGHVSPPDELGLPDLRLPELPQRNGQVVPRPIRAADDTGQPAGDAGDAGDVDDGFRQVGAGAAAVRLEAFWPGVGLGQYRPYDRRQRTFAWFQAYPLHTLPRLDEASFTGDFSWFGDVGEPLDYRTAVTDPIAADLAADGLTLPADFVALITRANLHRLLDREGHHACWTDVTGPLPSPVHPDDRMVLFLRDQQSCIVWYLYLHRDGGSCVVCSADDFTYEPGPHYGRDTVYWCAPTVGLFAYRFLIEARLATAIDEQRRAGDLDPELLAYLAHYVPGPRV